MTQWERNDAIQQKAWRTRYMAGWDAAIIGSPNPYRRADFMGTWEAGRKACLDRRPLPKWYQEWREGR